MKPKDGIVIALFAFCAYIVTDFVRVTKEKVARIAAGESDYERTHRRR